MMIQKKTNDGKERRFDPFFAGLVGGYMVFGERNAINEQVPRFSRVVLGRSKLTCFGRLCYTSFHE